MLISGQLVVQPLVVISLVVPHSYIGKRVYKGYPLAIVGAVADAMAKAADVKVVAIDKNKPAAGDSARVPLVMAVKVEGSAAAVEAAVMAGKAEADKRDLYITHKVIARQSEDIEWFARLSALGKDKLR